MTQLEIRLRPPMPDPMSFRDHTQSMSEEVRAVLSLRGFACTTSMMIPTYHLWLAATEAEPQDADYPSLVLRLFMRESMLDHLLIQLRRLYDPDRSSLSAGTISLSLATASIRDFLIERATSSSQKRVTLDRTSVDEHLSLVEERCSLGLVTRATNLAADAPMTQVQTYLARRAANKRAAHMTVDDYGITDSDIRDLCFSTVVVARALHRVFDEDVYSGNHTQVDAGAYEAAARVLGHRHSKGLLADALDENINMFLERIRTRRSARSDAQPGAAAERQQPPSAPVAAR